MTPPPDTQSRGRPVTRVYKNDEPFDPVWEEDQYVRIARPETRFIRAAIATALLILVAWVGYSRATGWFGAQLDPEGPPGAAIEVEIPEGTTTAEVSRILEASDIVPNATFFRYYLQFEDIEGFQAGTYDLPVNSSAEEATAVLLAGPKPLVYQTFTVPEGLWTDEILARVANQLPSVDVASLQLALSSGEVPERYRPEGQTSWEGLLFPDTYQVSEFPTATEALTKMADEFSRVTAELGYGAAETQLGYSAYQVLIVASLIESEAKLEEERPLIASVIYNRLREGWPLGIDATCIYGARDRQVVLTDEVLNQETPYNCRTHVGLPPTPISAPGRASLEAAINPDETDYFYYVLADASGRHNFAETDEEFEVFKAQAQEAGLLDQ